jgi:hypothetical protein
MTRSLVVRAVLFPVGNTRVACMVSSRHELPRPSRARDGSWVRLASISVTTPALPREHPRVSLKALSKARQAGVSAASPSAAG